MLLALVSGQRVQTLAALDLKDAIVKGSSWIFPITALMKTTRPGFHTKDIVLTKFSGVRLCVVRTLKEYIRRTNSHCISTKLFYLISEKAQTGRKGYFSMVAQNFASAV
jgi:hypothetical protein